jgi:hypothetical protein
MADPRDDQTREGARCPAPRGNPILDMTPEEFGNLTLDQFSEIPEAVLVEAADFFLARARERVALFPRREASLVPARTRDAKAERQIAYLSREMLREIAEADIEPVFKAHLLEQVGAAWADDSD